MTDLENKMSRVPHSREIDLRAWEFVDDLGDLLMHGFAGKVTETLREEFERDPPYLSFPFGWGDSDGIGGPRPDDPVTLHLHIPLGRDEEAVTYACSLEAVVDDLLDGFVIPATGKFSSDADDQAICAKIAARLRQLADKIDAAMTC